MSHAFLSANFVCIVLPQVCFVQQLQEPWHPSRPWFCHSHHVLALPAGVSLYLCVSWPSRLIFTVHFRPALTLFTDHFLLYLVTSVAHQGLWHLSRLALWQGRLAESRLELAMAGQPLLVAERCQSTLQWWGFYVFSNFPQTMDMHSDT